eukprot:7998607-Pyramimonas_sp.AAC.1
MAVEDGRGAVRKHVAEGESLVLHASTGIFGHSEEAVAAQDRLAKRQAKAKSGPAGDAGSGAAEPPPG